MGAACCSYQLVAMTMVAAAQAVALATTARTAAAKQQQQQRAGSGIAQQVWRFTALVEVLGVMVPSKNVLMGRVGS